MVGSRSAYTRKRILDAAARLFAQKGDGGTSLREITAEARVNLSSVNYHFGSKEGLVQAVVQQRLDALNQEQLAQLAPLEAQARNGGDIHAEDVVKAFFGPLIRHAIAQAMYAQGCSPPWGSPTADPNGLVRAVVMNEQREVLQRFGAALAKALPQTPTQELLWRFHLMLGAASNAIAGMDGLLLALSRTADEPFDVERLSRRLMPFLVAGLLAPLPGELEPEPSPGAMAADESPPNNNPALQPDA